MLKHIEGIERIRQELLKLIEEVTTNTGVDGVNQKITKDAVIRRLKINSERLEGIEGFIKSNW